jgi:hypothetical protein
MTCINWVFFHEWASLKHSFHSRFKGPRVPKKPNLHTNEVEYKVFLFDELLKGSKSPKIFKITGRFVLTSADIYQNPFT